MLIFLALIEDEENKNKFIELYEEYKDIVFSICIKITKNYHLAEDATQITFTKVAKHIDKISHLHVSDQKGYVSTIAKNTAINLSKSEKRFFYCDMNKQFSLSTNESVQNNYISEADYKEIVKFIFQMDEKYRDVLTLYYLVGLTPKDIATALDRPINTIQTQLKRGKQMVMKKFKELNIK